MLLELQWRSCTRSQKVFERATFVSSHNTVLHVVYQKGPARTSKGSFRSNRTAPSTGGVSEPPGTSVSHRLAIPAVCQQRSIGHNCHVQNGHLPLPNQAICVISLVSKICTPGWQRQPTVGTVSSFVRPRQPPQLFTDPRPPTSMPSRETRS